MWGVLVLWLSCGYNRRVALLHKVRFKLRPIQCHLRILSSTVSIYRPDITGRTIIKLICVNYASQKSTNVLISLKHFPPLTVAFCLVNVWPRNLDKPHDLHSTFLCSAMHRNCLQNSFLLPTCILSSRAAPKLHRVCFMDEGHVR